MTVRTCDVRKAAQDGATPPGPSAGHPSGMTLVEMLVSVVVGMMILALVVLIYNSASRSYVRQDAQIEQTQNLRVGLYSIIRDLRMAGGGFNIIGLSQAQRIQVPVYLSGQPATWFTYPGDPVSGAVPIFGVDGGSTGTDSVTVCWLGLESATPIGVLANPLSGGNDRLTLRQSPPQPSDANAAGDELLRGGDMLLVVDGSGNAMAVKTALDTDPTAQVIKFENNLPAPLPNSLASWPAGSQVFNIKSLRLVTYSIAANSSLIANLHGRDLGDADATGAVLVAPNIEDLQLRYFSAGTNPAISAGGREGLNVATLQTLNGPPPTLRIRGVSVALSSRSSAVDPHDQKHSPYKIFNHQDVGPEDKFPRRLLTETVQLRNY